MKKFIKDFSLAIIAFLFLTGGFFLHIYMFGYFKDQGNGFLAFLMVGLIFVEVGAFIPVMSVTILQGFLSRKSNAQ